MRIVVTGGSGFIGQHIVANLVAGGHDVVSADRSLGRQAGAKSAVVDLRVRESAYPLFEGADSIVHLANHPNAGRADAQTVLAENLTINTNVCQAAAELGVRRIVFASSIQAMADSLSAGPLPADGDTPARPDNVYGLSKILTEHMLAHYVRLHGLSAVAVRFPWVAGRKRHLEYLNNTAEFHGRHTRELGAWLWIEDAASLVAAILATDLPGFRVYLPSAALPTSFGPVDELARRLYPDAPQKRPDEPLTALIDTGQITRETGWKPRTIEQVLALA
ncbi:MAG: NAD(P)-dependent oxidoreductase [Verrucomicrobiota bacterium]